MNATDQKVVGADWFHTHCFLEVKDGNRWRACERVILGCGNSIPDPASLPAKHAAIFLGIDPNEGDLTGELRFCIAIQNDRPIVSTPFQGRFDSKRFEEAVPRQTPGSKSIVDGLTGMIAGKLPSQQGIARTLEEHIAAGELERCYDESSITKTTFVRWQATLPTSEETAPCRTALTALLKRPWDHQLDAPALFDRCFTALTGHNREKEFGSPERCRAMTWRYLSEFRSEWLELLINPERWDQLDTIRKSGNPWGVDNEHAVALVEEAIASLRSTDPDEREAAGTFLKGHWIGEKHLPDERCLFLLGQDSTVARMAAIAALERRGKGQQAGKWIVDHPDLSEPELAALWAAAIGNATTSPDWELPVALRLLENPSLETLAALARRSARVDDAGGNPFPAQVREPIRRILAQEAKAMRWIGLPPPNRGESDESESRRQDLRSREPDRLQSVLYAVAGWGDPADTSLLSSYLAHPAAIYSTTDKQIIRRYQIRSVAAELLRDRNEKLPEGIVFEEPVN
jgi:hypothetical protein